MARFLIRFFSFMLVAGVLFFLTCEGIMRYPTVFEKMGYSAKWFKVYRIASKSKEEIASDTLFIGDSVGAQFFPYTSSQNYMPINGAILMPGQFMIAANTMASNPDLKCIVLVCSPASLGAKFNDQLTCNNFVKPFYRKENFKYITPNLREKIEAKQFAFFYQFSIVKFLPFSDINYLSGKFDPTILSEVSIEYLKKMETLCKENKVALRIISAPLEKKHFDNTNNWASLRTQINQEGLQDIFEGYFESIEYLERDKFIEGIHIKHELVDNFRSNLLTYLNQGI